MSDEVIRIANLEIRPAEFQLLADGQRVGLTVREFQTFLVLAERPDRVVTRPEIYARVWGGQMAYRDRSVDVFVRKVRQQAARVRAELGLHPHALRDRLPLLAGAGCKVSDAGSYPAGKAGNARVDNALFRGDRMSETKGPRAEQRGAGTRQAKPKQGASRGEAGKAARRRAAPKARYFNRELSWLDFNARVLALAEDPQTPLLERAKFLAIFASNLDEFFQVRVAGLKQQVEAGIRTRSSDGLTPQEQLSAIAAKVVPLAERHARPVRRGRDARARASTASRSCAGTSSTTRSATS